MSSDSGSDQDMECGEVDEGADIRVMQSSLKVSIIQNSLFKVTEKKNEDDSDSDCDQKPIKQHRESESPELPQKQELEPQISQEDSINIQNRRTSSNDLTPISQKPEKTAITSSYLQHIFNEEKKQKPRSLDLEKRLFDYREKIAKKLEDLKAEQEVKITKICTFQPKTKTKLKENRNFSHFLIHMEEVEKAKKESLEKKLNEKAEEENPKKLNFKPTLTKKTIKLASKHKSTGDLHDKLFREANELKNKKEVLSKAILNQMCSFKPSVNKRSADLKREGSISQRLHDQSNKNKLLVMDSATLKYEKLISEESENIIRSKLFKEISDNLPKENGEYKSFLNFSEFLSLLLNLHLIQNESTHMNYLLEQECCHKAWMLLEGSDGSSIESSKISEFLLAILNLPTHPTDFNKLQSDFHLFHQNRLTFTNTSNQVKSLSFPFKPFINKKSEEISKTVKLKRIENYMTSTPETVLELIENQAKKDLEKKRKAMLNQLPIECTFSPEILRGPLMIEECFVDNQSLSTDYLKIAADPIEHRGDLLYRFAKVEQERKQKMMRTIEDCEIEDNMGECTFTPCLEKTLRSKVAKEERQIESHTKKFIKFGERNPKDLSPSALKKVLNAELNKNFDDGNQDYLTDAFKELIKMDTLKSYYNENIN